MPVPNHLKRVSIVSSSCCGKSTFAEELEAILGSKHVQIDALNWLPDWESRPLPELRDLLRREIEADRWMAD